MKALLCTELGSFDRLAVHDVPSPTPGPGEVVVDVKASSINFPDALMVKGLYQVKPPLPFTPGAELAGVVKEAGGGVAQFAPGDRVLGFCRLGGFAEEALAPADQFMPLPPAMDFDVAAAFGLTYGTSLHALQDCARLQAGETLLVLGAGGGVGSAAVELGKFMGARVIAAASSEDKLAVCRRLGADETIDYGRDDLRERLKGSRAGRASTSSTTPSAARIPSPRCGRRDRAAGSWSSASPAARSPRSRSTWRCSTSAPSSASTGANGRAGTRPRTPALPPC
jgi:NADPH2:quinone reductase